MYASILFHIIQICSQPTQLENNFTRSHKKKEKHLALLEALWLSSWEGITRHFLEQIPLFVSTLKKKGLQRRRCRLLPPAQNFQRTFPMKYLGLYIICKNVHAHNWRAKKYELQYWRNMLVYIYKHNVQSNTIQKTLWTLLECPEHFVLSDTHG